jgi:malate/lactate dehydrogenase
VRGYAGVKHDVYLSVPSIIGASGVKRLIELELNDLERKQFHASADIIWKAQAGIWDTI